jgi:hypothetical protein
MKNELNTKILKDKDEVGLKDVISHRANPWNVIGGKFAHSITLLCYKL